MRNTFLLLLLLLCPGLAWAQPVSDPGKTLTIIPPRGWTAGAQGKALALASSDQTASIALAARDSIPLEDAVAMKAIVAGLTGDGWKPGRQSPAKVGGVPALRVEVDGVSGDYANDKGFFYLVSEPQRGWIIFCLSSKQGSSKAFPLMEASLRSLTFSR